VTSLSSYKKGSAPFRPIPSPNPNPNPNPNPKPSNPNPLGEMGLGETELGEMGGHHKKMRCAYGKPLYYFIHNS